LRRADQGDAYAQAVVSIYYGTGYLTARDAAKAADYAIRSAKQRHPLGLYRLGAMLQNGDGVPMNQEEGARLKQASFEGINNMGGDPYAITALGVMVFRGEGVRKDRAEAARLYKLAADLGYAPAQYNYSACLLAGHGVRKDPAQAEAYWRKAYDQGYELALQGMPR
jgi:TPR repeat protein